MAEIEKSEGLPDGNEQSNMPETRIDLAVVPHGNMYITRNPIFWKELSA